MTHDAPATMPAHQSGVGHVPATAATGAAADDAKTWATLQARAALAGWTLAKFTEPDGTATYCLSKWGRPVELRDLAAVAQHLRRVGAPE